MPAKKSTKKVIKKTTRKTAAKQAATKKVPAKKQTTTKRAVKKVAKPTLRPLVVAPEAKKFWTKDGQILDSLIALNESLNSMEEEVFSYHATGDQNDFAEWVEHVLQDAECAEALRRSRKATTARTAIKKQLTIYFI